LVIELQFKIKFLATSVVRVLWWRPWIAPSLRGIVFWCPPSCHPLRVCCRRART